MIDDIPKTVRLANCPIGLFMCGDDLCLMTEYATETKDGHRQRDAYIVSSGEYFWGGTSTSADRNEVMVVPIDAAALSVIQKDMVIVPREEMKRLRAAAEPFNENKWTEASIDDAYSEAVQIVKQTKRTHTSYLQRRMLIGYGRAAELVDMMESRGVISAPDQSGKRRALV